MPIMALMKQVQPRRKKSQLKPAGLVRGNLRAWAIREETLWS